MQDTPANRITYKIGSIVNSVYNVQMSANSTGSRIWNMTHTAYTFDNQIPMPSYLIAIAVGYLDVRPLDSRTAVISEHCFVDEVAETLASVPELLTKMETYLTTYIWGHYSILVLPGSFPMGGMENPLLTFASPTIITSDKSQVYVATHEIAHSWTGNQITCENWNNFWLNEGFTVFEERNVSAEIHGKDFSLVNAYLGNISMYGAM
jgi:leukotriene-A4 hydrolase